jgi:YHS domain-containing protein
MKKVFMLVAVATLALTGIVSAEEMAVKDAVVPVVEKAAAPAVEAAVPAVVPAAVVVGNTVCPVCGMEIPADQLGKTMVDINGKVFNVCSVGDKDKALIEPDKYLKIAEDSVKKAEVAPVPEAAAPVAEEKK